MGEAVHATGVLRRLEDTLGQGGLVVHCLLYSRARERIKRSVAGADGVRRGRRLTGLGHEGDLLLLVDEEAEHEALPLQLHVDPLGRGGAHVAVLLAQPLGYLDVERRLELADGGQVIGPRGAGLQLECTGRIR